MILEKEAGRDYFNPLDRMITDVSVEVSSLEGPQIKRHPHLLNSLGEDVVFITTLDFFQRMAKRGIDVPVLISESFTSLDDVSKKALKELCRCQKIAGWVDRDYPLEYYIPLMATLLSKTVIPKASDFEKYGKNLDKILEKTLNELQRVKEIHGKIIPLRQEKFKGVNILSKYYVGKNPGGEFFDILKGPQELILLLSSSRSYVTSSVVLSYFEKLRNRTDFSREFLKRIVFELTQDLFDFNLPSSEREGVQLFLMRIDLKSLKVIGYSFGETEIISGSRSQNQLSENQYYVDEAFLENVEFEFMLKRNEKIVILSPGLRKNCQDFLGGIKLNHFIYEKMSSASPRELIDEVFFHLKKNRDDEFLDYDASLMFIEVEKNVIIQV